MASEGPAVIPTASAAAVGPTTEMAAVTPVATSTTSAATPSTASGSLSGFVFFGPTPSGATFNPTSPAPGESPLAGVTVTLAGVNGTETITTDATGAYSFNNLAPGTYSLSVAAPTGDANAESEPDGSNGTASTGTISDIVITAGQNQANENFPVTIAASSQNQLQQIYFTASLLVSGAQIPIAPFEQVVTPAPTPNVPQQVGPPTPLPGLTGRTFQVAGSQSIPQGGSGGDAILGGANPASPLYNNNADEQVWQSFGEQGVNNWLNEGPEEDLMQRLTDLGDMNLLNGGDRGLPNSASPSGGGSDSRGVNDRINDLFNFNDRQSDDGILGDGFFSDGELIQANAQGVGDGHAVLLEPVTVSPINNLRLPVEADWSPTASLSSAAVAAWMLVTSQGGAESADRGGYFESRRKHYLSNGSP